jgi:plastocyanin
VKVTSEFTLRGLRFGLIVTFLFAESSNFAVAKAAQEEKPQQSTGEQARAGSVKAESPAARRVPPNRRRKIPNYSVSEVKDGGVLKGAVTYKGPVPPAKKIQVVKDHATCDARPKEESLIKIDAQGMVGEAVVFLGDISRGKDFSKRDKSPVIDQRVCTFDPHVQAVVVKEPVDILNSDPVAHNINANQRIFTLFNVLQPQQNMRATQQFDKPGLVNLKCNVHDWMHAYVYVFNHPYYQVTKADGAFALENVPPGKYEMVVWQEHLGETAFDVEVKPGQTSELLLVLPPPEQAAQAVDNSK